MNYNELHQLVAKIEESGIKSMSVGLDDGYIDEAGSKHNFDIYRFINQDLVTFYPAQEDLNSEQKTFFIDKYLNQIGVPKEEYFFIFQKMKDTKIISFYHEEEYKTIYMPLEKSWYNKYIPNMPGGGTLFDYELFYTNDPEAFYIGETIKINDHWGAVKAN